MIFHDKISLISQAQRAVDGTWPIFYMPLNTSIFVSRLKYWDNSGSIGGGELTAEKVRQLDIKLIIRFRNRMVKFCQEFYQGHNMSTKIFSCGKR